MRTILLVTMALTPLAGGCSSFFNGAAPAADGGYYAVGAKQGFNTQAAMWHCPKGGAEPAKCEQMQVEEQ